MKQKEINNAYEKIMKLGSINNNSLTIESSFQSNPEAVTIQTKIIKQDFCHANLEPDQK